MPASNNYKWIGVAAGLLILSVVLCVTLWPSEPHEPHPGSSDPNARSINIDVDIRLMWETRSMGKTHDPSHGKNPHSSPDHAINAASRVFNTVDLVGKSTKEVIKLLGDPVASNNSIYNFPFWPPPEHGLVYRFDTGAYGWQFNVETQNDIVVSVEKLWIH